MKAQRTGPRIEGPNTWAVAFSCPQCSAPVTLEETDRILTCAYCRVRLVLLYPGHPRYRLLPFQERTEDRELLYLPYWRIRGMAFDAHPNRKKDRVIDVTFSALSDIKIPPHLGLQARAFKLHYLSPDVRGRFLKPRISWEEVWPLVGAEPSGSLERPMGQWNPALPWIFIGETISQVFAPIYFQGGMIFDGLGDRPWGRGEASDFQKFDEWPTEAFPPLQCLPALCPYCGADLQGEKDTYVLLCRHCDRVWDLTPEGLKAMDFGVLESEEDHPGYFLPFWRVHETEPPKGPSSLSVQESDPFPGLPQNPLLKKGSPRYFWLPAFKLSPSVFLTAAKAMTLRQPRECRLRQTLSHGRYYPVNLPWEQAEYGLQVLNTRLRKSAIGPSASVSGRFKELAPLLIYIPFQLKGGEWVQGNLSVGISQAALHFGRFI